MGFQGTERFEVRRRLGAGSFGVVYEVWDSQRSRSVALKLLQKVSGDTLYRFKNEFRSLSGIRHRNLVRLYELLFDGEQWFYTMELIHGTELLEHLAGQEIERAFAPRIDGDAEDGTDVTPASQPLSSEYVRDLVVAMRQLVEGIAALHSAGKLHRDIKPSNILVAADGRVVLLDFGLIRELHADDFDDFWLVGTPGYMSPEQTSGEALTAASDWYSVGVILYQALTGTLPFTGTFAEIAVAQQSHRPLSPSSLIGGIPAELEDLAVALLSIDPADRPSVEEIRRALGGHELTFWLPPFRRRAHGPDDHFVGREQELATLRESFERCRQGKVEHLFVQGASGTGKTALVNHFLDQLRREGEVIILGGRCYEKESVPYKAFDDIVDALTRRMRRGEPGTDAILRKELSAVCRLFPVLGRVETIARSVTAQRAEAASPAVRRRGFAAFAGLLATLSEHSPLILFVDDAHWGDLDSAELMIELLQYPVPARILVIITYTTEDAATSLFLQRLRKQRDGGIDLAVQPFDGASTRELARILLDELASEKIVESIAAESRGNAFLIDELARAAREHPGRSVSLIEIFRERLQSVPPEARWLLQVIALAGEPLPVSIALTAASLQPKDEDLLSLLRDARLIRSRVSGELEEVEIYHQRVRQVVFRDLSSEAQQKIHATLGSVLEWEGAAEPEALARHFYAAGMLDKAAKYAIDGGDVAFHALAFDRAARLYMLALEVDPEHAVSAIGSRLGHALENAGKR